jgi:hypothetical protein
VATYIETKSMLVDKLSWMAALLPDRFPDYLPGKTLSGEFEDLFEGIDVLRNRLGPERHNRCVAMAREAQSAYDSGDNERGEDILMSMRSVITGIKSTRLRDMEPSMRAHVEAGGKFTG